MKTLVSTLGLVGAAALMAALLLNPPSSGPLEAREDPKADCRMMAVDVDEGYGVTLKALRPVCPKTP